MSLGRPFFQASPKKCKSKILLQITTRFDFGHIQDKNYTLLFKSMVENLNIYWQSNNEYEREYLHLNGIFPKQECFWLIKPIGNLINMKHEKPTSSQVVIFNRHFDLVEKELMKLIEHLLNKCEFKRGKNYGGPHQLAKHKLFVYFPYQFSTMKVFENLYAGVLTAVPSPNFLLELLTPAFTKSKYRMQEQIIILSKKYSYWTEYIDVYNGKFKSLFIQFESFIELAKLIDNDIELKRDKFLNARKEIMNEHEKKQHMIWDHLFEAIFPN